MSNIYKCGSATHVANLHSKALLLPNSVSNLQVSLQQTLSFGPPNSLVPQGLLFCSFDHRSTIRIRIFIIRLAREQFLQIHQIPHAPSDILRLALLPYLSIRAIGTDVADLALQARRPVVEEVCRLANDALGVLRVVGAPPAQRVIKDPSQFLNRRPEQEFLSRSVVDRVRKAADRAARHVNEPRMLRIGLELVDVVRLEAVVIWNALVVWDNVHAIVVLGKHIGAYANPQDIPPFTIRRVRPSICWIVHQPASALGEVDKLGFDTNVPVHIVFQDQSG